MKHVLSFLLCLAASSVTAQDSIEDKVAALEEDLRQQRGLSFIDYADMNDDGVTEGLYVFTDFCDAGLCPWRVYDFSSGEPVQVAQSMGDSVRFVMSDDEIALLYVDGVIHEYFQGNLVLGYSLTEAGVKRDPFVEDVQILNASSKFDSLTSEDLDVTRVFIPEIPHLQKPGRVFDVAVINDIYYNAGPSMQSYAIIENGTILHTDISSDIPRIFLNDETGNPVIVNVSTSGYFAFELLK